MRNLQNRLKNVLQVSEKLGYKLVSIATHPFSRWKDQSVTKTDRYLHFLERMQWPLRRLLITGVHVHIGVESGEKAIAITNGLTRYIPHMIGLSANSPYFDGEKTGLASTRTKIFEGMPTAGLPPQLRNYSEFQKFMRSLQRANTIETISQQVNLMFQETANAKQDEFETKEEFEDMTEMVELRPIPAVILNVYKRIFK